MQPEFSYMEHILARNGFNYGFLATERLCSSSFYPMEETLEFGEKLHESRSVAASEHHKEAERRRRERINGHLDSLRTLLLCSSKTDKASLLAMVVERVRELKQQTSEIMQRDQAFPSEADEIAVLQNDDFVDGKCVVKASLCCEDRVDLIPELIEILKPLSLSPLRAEMVTLGGRIRNVMIFAGDKDRTVESASLLREGLKSLILRSNYVGRERSKRTRMFDHRIIR
ncbi:basic helix-loop-helix DNA-binding superfamily protein [Perilla frutescens var. hirtella]|nr:basic helix-loop-helix DNA-binding superfamily protein [Perilla frutescens var. hirtella]